MLKDNIKTIRKLKGLSQEELAIKLNVVRQTISKWEQGLSVPDSELLVSLSDALDTPVGTLLGGNIVEPKEDSLKEIKRKIWNFIFISICVILIVILIGLIILGNTYMEWNYNDPESVVLKVGVHSFVWLFVRIAPIVFICSIIGIYLTRKKR